MTTVVQPSVSQTADAVAPRRRRPRVVHLVPALFGERGVTGGAERYAFELARHMADVVPTTLLSFADADIDERAGALRVRALGRPWHVRGQRTNPFSLRLLGALRGADVVHCHQQHVLASSVAAIASRLAGRRVFVSDLGGGGWDLSAYVSTDRWYHGHLHISAYSRAVFGHGALDRARVIYGGVDGARFSPDPATPKSGRVLFVGRVLPHKGVDDLVAALPSALGLDVVGRVTDERFGARLRELARGKDVRFHHDVDDAGLLRWYRQALCIVLPSVYRAYDGSTSRVPELLGQTLLEGMACGLPAVCTDVASMPEIVTHRETGFVVPANDPGTMGARLSELAADPARAAAMGTRARADVLDRFSWARVVERCLHAYAGEPFLRRDR